MNPTFRSLSAGQTKSSSLAKLGLGVSRFGAPVSDATPRGPNEAEAFAIMALAAEAGVRLVDIGGGAPGGEEILARVLPREPAFEITLKTSVPDEGGVDAVLRRARASVDRLSGRALRAVLLRPAALLLDSEGPRLWAGLRAMQDEGLVAALGLCACVCDDPVGLARRYRPDVMQLPFSLVDQRLLSNGAMGELAAMGVELHLRSIFLRGRLFNPGPTAASPQLSHLRRLLAEAGADPMQAALAFAMDRVEASKVIVGIGSPLELRAVLAAARAPHRQIDWEVLRQEAGPCRLNPRACRAA